MSVPRPGLAAPQVSPRGPALTPLAGTAVTTTLRNVSTERAYVPALAQALSVSAETPVWAGRYQRRPQPAGAAIGSTPARSWRVTRIAASVMIRASKPIAAEAREPCEKPAASAG